MLILSVCRLRRQLALVNWVKGVVRGRPREVGQLIKVLLLLSHVPVEAFGQGGEPVWDLILGADRGHGVDRGGDVQAAKCIKKAFQISYNITFHYFLTLPITMGEFLAFASIKWHPRCIPAIWRYRDLERPVHSIMNEYPLSLEIILESEEYSAKRSWMA